MRKIRETMRLYEHSGLTQRQISKALNISRPVVSDYLTRLRESGVTYEDMKGMPDEILLEILQNNRLNEDKRYKILRDKFPYFVKELKRLGVTRQILWEEYLAEYPDGYSYSQFCYHFQVWQNMSELTMHIDHKAGDKLFVDFAGKKLSIIDRTTGKEQFVEVFVAILGSSQLVYVEASFSQKKEDWIRLNENALRYIGGIPRAIVPDCLKSAVTKVDRFEPDLNPEYLDFARHYDTAILPARPGKPKDKALVEGVVRITYSWIYARLRNRVFFSLEELNEAIFEQLESFNLKIMQRPGLSRRELFESIEKKELKPLPLERYEMKKFKVLTVKSNYHIFLCEDNHYYSVPYRYRGQKVEVFFTERNLEVYSGNTRLALHFRSKDSNRYTTDRKHMPESHKHYNDWNPEELINQAVPKGASVTAMIEAVLALPQHPEQSYKTCIGILSLSKKFGDNRLQTACKLALSFDRYTYKSVKSILSSNMDLVEAESYDLSLRLPEHENIRGNEYYKEEIQ